MPPAPETRLLQQLAEGPALPPAVSQARLVAAEADLFTDLFIPGRDCVAGEGTLLPASDALTDSDLFDHNDFKLFLQQLDVVEEVNLKAILELPPGHISQCLGDVGSLPAVSTQQLDSCDSKQSNQQLLPKNNTHNAHCDSLPGEEAPNGCATSEPAEQPASQTNHCATQCQAGFARQDLEASGDPDGHWDLLLPVHFDSPSLLALDSQWAPSIPLDSSEAVPWPAAAELNEQQQQHQEHPQQQLQHQQRHDEEEAEHLPGPVTLPAAGGQGSQHVLLEAPNHEAHLPQWSPHEETPTPIKTGTYIASLALQGKHQRAEAQSDASDSVTGARDSAVQSQLEQQRGLPAVEVGHLSPEGVLLSSLWEGPMRAVAEQADCPHDALEQQQQFPISAQAVAVPQQTEPQLNDSSNQNLPKALAAAAAVQTPANGRPDLSRRLATIISNLENRSAAQYTQKSEEQVLALTEGHCVVRGRRGLPLLVKASTVAETDEADWTMEGGRRAVGHVITNETIVTGINDSDSHCGCSGGLWSAEHPSLPVTKRQRGIVHPASVTQGSCQHAKDGCFAFDSHTALSQAHMKAGTSPYFATGLPLQSLNQLTARGLPETDSFLERAPPITTGFPPASRGSVLARPLSFSTSSFIPGRGADLMTSRDHLLHRQLFVMAEAYASQQTVRR